MPSGCEALATSSKSASTSISRRSATTRLLRAPRQRKNCIRRSHATSRATTAPIGAACDCNALQRSDSYQAAARDREKVRGTRHAARGRRRGQRRRETALPARATTGARRHNTSGFCGRRPHPTTKTLRHPVDREVRFLPGRALAGGHGGQSSRRRRGGRPDDARDKSGHRCSFRLHLQRLGVFHAIFICGRTCFTSHRCRARVLSRRDYSRCRAGEKNCVHDDVRLDGRRLPLPDDARARLSIGDDVDDGLATSSSESL